MPVTKKSKTKFYVGIELYSRTGCCGGIMIYKIRIITEMYQKIKEEWMDICERLLSRYVGI